MPPPPPLSLLVFGTAGNGFFINTALLMFSMLVNAWLCLLLVLLSGVSRNSSVLDDSLAVVGGLQLLQLGSLSLLVYIATVWLEDGFFTTIKNVLKQFVAGSMLFYIFRGQTSAHAFRSDLAFGGATYAATGRGYKLKVGCACLFRSSDGPGVHASKWYTLRDCSYVLSPGWVGAVWPSCVYGGHLAVCTA